MATGELHELEVVNINEVREYLTGFASEHPVLHVQYVEVKREKNKRPMRRGVVVGFVTTEGVCYVGWSLCRAEDRKKLRDDEFQVRALYMAIKRSYPAEAYLDGTAIHVPYKLQRPMANMMRRTYSSRVSQWLHG